MFFKKNERKKHSACLILTVGALAAVGALTITKRGKEIWTSAKDKMTGMFKKEECTAIEDSGGQS